MKKPRRGFLTPRGIQHRHHAISLFTDYPIPWIRHERSIEAPEQIKLYKIPEATWVSIYFAVLLVSIR